MKELDSCLKKLDRRVFKKPRSFAIEQKSEMNKLELRSQLGRKWENLLFEYFKNEMRAPSSAQPPMVSPFIWTEGQLLFTWCLAGVALEDLTSCNELKLVKKGLYLYRILMQHVPPDDSGLSPVRRKDANCFLRWIMSVIPDSVIQACQQKAMKNRALENRVSSVILNVY